MKTQLTGMSIGFPSPSPPSPSPCTPHTHTYSTYFKMVPMASFCCWVEPDSVHGFFSREHATVAVVWSSGGRHSGVSKLVVEKHKGELNRSVTFESTHTYHAIEYFFVENVKDQTIYIPFPPLLFPPYPLLSSLPHLLPSCVPPVLDSTCTSSRGTLSVPEQSSRWALRRQTPSGTGGPA